jgi:hypothetical protein
MRTTYIYLGFEATSEHGPIISEAVKAGSVTIAGLECAVISVDAGRYADVHHVVLRTGPEENPDDVLMGLPESLKDFAGI